MRSSGRNGNGAAGARDTPNPLGRVDDLAALLAASSPGQERDQTRRGPFWAPLSRQQICCKAPAPVSNLERGAQNTCAGPKFGPPNQPASQRLGAALLQWRPSRSRRAATNPLASGRPQLAGTRLQRGPNWIWSAGCASWRLISHWRGVLPSERGRRAASCQLGAASCQSQAPSCQPRAAEGQGRVVAAHSSSPNKPLCLSLSEECLRPACVCERTLGRALCAVRVCLLSAVLPLCCTGPQTRAGRPADCRALRAAHSPPDSPHTSSRQSARSPSASRESNRLGQYVARSAQLVSARLAPPAPKPAGGYLAAADRPPTAGRPRPQSLAAPSLWPLVSSRQSLAAAPACSPRPLAGPQTAGAHFKLFLGASPAAAASQKSGSSALSPPSASLSPAQRPLPSTSGRLGVAG